jgi:voltage-gated potassium channel
MAGSAEALERFERQSAWPMLVLSVAIIPLLVIPLTVDLSPPTESVFVSVDWLIWAAFAIEYGIRLYLAPNKGRFVKGHVLDLVVVSRALPASAPDRALDEDAPPPACRPSHDVPPARD